MQPEKVDSPKQLPWIGEAEPLSRHRQSWGETSVLMQHDIAIFVLGVIAAVVIVVVTERDFNPHREYHLIALGIVMVCGVWLAFDAYRHKPKFKDVRVYPEGVAWSDGKGWCGWRWTDFEWYYLAQVTVNGGWTVRQFVLESEDGKRFVFEATIERWNNLANLIQEKHDEVWWPRLTEAFDAGKKIAFGPITVSQRGMKAGEVALSWNNIGQFNLYNGEVSIANLNGKRGFKFPIMDIPNFKMFCKMVHGAMEHVAAQDK